MRELHAARRALVGMALHLSHLALYATGDAFARALGAEDLIAAAARPPSCVRGGTTLVSPGRQDMA